MVLIAIEDITERKLQKQQLITQNQALSEAIIASKAANRVKSKFLGNISHELRTPLNAIMGFSQILQSMPSLEAGAQQYLEIIYQSGEHLLYLIQDLLDISRIEAEKMAIEPNLLALTNFLQITVDMIRIKTAEKNLTLTTQFAADLPANIYADEKRLRQVLLNLLANAIKFTDMGEITFAVSKIQSVDPAGSTNELIKFAIADTGVGIDRTELEKIFLPFEQFGAEKVKSQGTGLGLAISQSLVKKMGGTISVSSELGAGSTFRFELDLMDRKAANTETVFSPPQSDRLLVQSSISNQLMLSEALPLSILIAEDFEFNQVMMQKFLQTLGYEPDMASNGIEVLAKLRDKHYDVILLDIQMPEMDGMEVTKIILEEWDEESRPYIIAVTANMTDEAQASYLAAGMKAYIGKPIDFNQLEQALSQVPSRTS